MCVYVALCACVYVYRSTFYPKARSPPPVVQKKKPLPSCASPPQTDLPQTEGCMDPIWHWSCPSRAPAGRALGGVAGLRGVPALGCGGGEGSTELMETERPRAGAGGRLVVVASSPQLWGGQKGLDGPPGVYLLGRTANEKRTKTVPKKQKTEIYRKYTQRKTTASVKNILNSNTR